VSPDQKIAIAWRAIEAFNNKDWDAARAALTSDCYYDEVATSRADGVEAIIELWQGWAKTLPDARAKIERSCVSENTVILELSWTGTMTGPMESPTGEIPPTNKPFANRGCWLAEVDGERSKAIRQYFDVLTMMKSVGIA